MIYTKEDIHKLQIDCDNLRQSIKEGLAIIERKNSEISVEREIIKINREKYNKLNRIIFENTVGISKVKTKDKEKDKNTFSQEDYINSLSHSELDEVIKRLEERRNN